MISRSEFGLQISGTMWISNSVLQGAGNSQAIDVNTINGPDRFPELLIQSAQSHCSSWMFVLCQLFGHAAGNKTPEGTYFPYHPSSPKLIMPFYSFFPVL